MQPPATMPLASSDFVTRGRPLAATIRDMPLTPVQSRTPAGTSCALTGFYRRTMAPSAVREFHVLPFSWLPFQF